MSLFGSSDWIIAYTLVVAIVTAIVHIGFAIHVGREATHLHNAERLTYGPPAFWILATLIGGVLAAVGYWVVNHSTLRND